MRVDIDTGSTSTSGRITTAGAHARLIEWHARKGNKGNVYVGKSDVSTSNGSELAPDAAVTWDLTNVGRDGEPGNVLFANFYVAFEVGGDWLDWTIFTTLD
tara:strand:- start:885 stop:1187 length:303 start_codon:yes stop_codon:yes gene_type:complete